RSAVGSAGRLAGEVLQAGRAIRRAPHRNAGDLRWETDGVDHSLPIRTGEVDCAAIHSGSEWQLASATALVKYHEAVRRNARPRWNRKSVQLGFVSAQKATVQVNCEAAVVVELDEFSLASTGHRQKLVNRNELPE